MNSLLNAGCFVLIFATSAWALPPGPTASRASATAACAREGSHAQETCTVTPSFYFKNGEEQYYLHFSSKCSRPVRVSGTYDGAPFGVYIGANSTNEVAIGRKRPESALLRWGFEIE